MNPPPFVSATRVAWRVLLICLLLATGGLSPAQTADRDRFGGWTAQRFEATGFFRLQKGGDPKRWWLVTPEGNAFLIHGMDHCHSHVLWQPYNREHWTKELRLASDATERERLQTFYQRKVSADRAYLGFNCLYSHAVPRGVERVAPFIPRVKTVSIEYWARRANAKRPFAEVNFPDVFADAFKRRCAASAQVIVRNGWREDPWIVGYGLTDSPTLTVRMAMPHEPGFFHKRLSGTTTWPVRLRNLGPKAAGKRAYVDLMKRRYDGDVQAFNNAYNTAFTTWNELAAAEQWRVRTDPSGNAAEARDNHAFLLQILDRCWGEQVKAIRAVDSNHLIIGDTLNLNEPLSDDVIRVYARHFPVITYQYYGATWEDHAAVMDRLRRVAPDKPMFSADSSWAVPAPPRMPEPLGPQCATEEVRARRFDEVYRRAFARPDFIGWGWCGWMDMWEVSEPMMQHGGLQDPFGRWHQPIADAMSRFGREMYDIATPTALPRRVGGSSRR